MPFFGSPSAVYLLAEELVGPRRFVYILRSANNPKRRYIGLTADVEARLLAHNAGQNPSTTLWKPWVVDVCIAFRTEQMAADFERYLKSGSGHAFANRHFCGDK